MKNTAYCELSTKDFVEGTNTFVLKGYASVFGNVDLDGDIIEKGAFHESLKSRTPQMLWGHDQSGVPIGKVTTIEEDSKGLYFEAALPKDDDLVKGRIAPQLRIGALKGISIGFRIKDRERLKDGGRRIKTAELWEISLVNIPANPEASVEHFKSAKGVCKDADLPLAQRGKSWDSESALKRVAEFAKQADDPADVYSKAFLYCAGGDLDDMSSYKFPIADVIGDRLTAIPHAIYKSATALMRMKDGDIASPVRDALQDTLDRYYTRLDLPSAIKSLSISEWKALDAGEREVRLRAGSSLSGGLAKMLSGQREVGRNPRDAGSSDEAKDLLLAIKNLTGKLA